VQSQQTPTSSPRPDDPNVPPSSTAHLLGHANGRPPTSERLNLAFTGANTHQDHHPPSRSRPRRASREPRPDHASSTSALHSPVQPPGSQPPTPDDRTTASRPDAGSASLAYQQAHGPGRNGPVDQRRDSSTARGHLRPTVTPRNGPAASRTMDVVSGVFTPLHHSSPGNRTGVRRNTQEYRQPPLAIQSTKGQVGQRNPLRPLPRHPAERSL